jgi:hypothetical protein
LVGVVSSAGVELPVDVVAGDVAEPPVVMTGVGAQPDKRGVHADLLLLREDAFGLFDHDSTAEGDVESRGDARGCWILVKAE